MIDLGQSLNNFTNALQSAANTTVNIGTDMMEKQAQLDMFNMQADLEERTSQFMAELENDGDYANWTAKTSDFLNKLKSETGNPDSPLYCRNNFTAEKFNQALTTADGQLRRTVQAMARKKQVEHTQLQNEKTLDYYQNTLKGQDRINASVEIINLSKDQGIYSEAQAVDMKRQIVTQAVMEDVQDLYYKTAKANPNWSEAKVKEYVENNKSLFTVDGDSEYTKKIDTKKAKEAGEKIAQTQIKQDQYDNNVKLYSVGTNLRDSVYKAGNNPTALQSVITQCDNQINYIKNLPKGYISEEDRRARMEELHATKNIAKLASGEKSSDSEKLASFRTLAGNNLKQFIQYGQNGENSNEPGMKNAKVAYEAYKDSLRVSLAQGVKDEAGNKIVKSTKEEQDLYIAQHAQDIVGNFFDQFYKDTLAKPEYAGIKTELNSLISDMTNPKNKGMYSENAAGQLTDYCIDLMTSVDLSTAKPEDIIKELRNKKNLCYLDKANSLSIKKSWGENFNNSSYIGRIADTLKNNDAVFTDVEGKEKWFGNSKEKADELSNTLREQILKDTGLNAKDVTYEYKRTEDDMESTPIFNVNGKKIEIQSDGKNGYKYVDAKTGATISKDSLKSSTPSIESQQKKNREEYNSLQRQKIEEQNKNFNNLSERTLTVNSIPPAVQKMGYKWETGKTNAPQAKAAIGESRQSVINDVIIEINKNSKKGNEAFKAIKGLPSGMTINEFNKLSQNEKYNYILGIK